MRSQRVGAERGRDRPPRGIRWIAWPTGSRGPPPPTSSSTPTTPSTGRSGRTRPSPRRGAATCRSCSRSGYAACHWCHVMAHESFEDDERGRRPSTRGFVAVKVDREERPDIDAVYMAATTALTGHGGWPMTCFLTPDGEPVLLRHLLPPRPLPRSCCRRRARRGPSSASGCCVGRARSRRGCARSAAPPSAAPPSAQDVLRRRGARGCAGQFDDGPRRVRRRAQVPAVDGARVPAAPPRAAPASRDALAMAERHLRGDGPRRHVRPARRRLRPLRRRRRLGGAALREDALRQRPAAAGLRAPVARDRRPAGPPGRRRRPPTSCCATSAPRRAGSPRPSTPTPVDGVRGPDLRLDPRPARRGARRRATARGRPRCSGVTDAGTFEHGASTLQLRRDPDDPRVVGGGARRGCSRRAAAAPAAGPRRQGRHVVERPGHRRPRRRRGAARTRRDLVAAAECLRRLRAATCTSSTDGCAGRPAAGAVGTRRRRSSTTTATSPRACSPCTRRPASRAGCEAAGRAARHVARTRFAAPRRGLPRHGRRRRAPLHPPARRRPTTPSPSGQSALAGALLTYAALTGQHRAPRGRGGGARRVCGLVASATRASPGGPSRWPRPRSPARCRWRSPRPRARRPQAAALVAAARQSRPPGWSLAHGAPGHARHTAARGATAGPGPGHRLRVPRFRLRRARSPSWTRCAPRSA